LKATTYLLSRHGSGAGNITGDLDVLGDATILGKSRATTIINGDAADRIFENTGGGSLTLRRMTITNGKSGIGGYGTMPIKGGNPALTAQDIQDLAAFIITQNLIPAGQRPYSPGDLAKSTIAWVTIGTLAMLALTYLLSRYNMRWIAFKSRRSA